MSNKDDSITQGLKLIHQRRLSKKVQPKDPKPNEKIRSILNRNITMNNRKIMNGDNSRTDKMKKLMSAVSQSPNGRAVMSNMRARPNQTIEHRAHTRAFSSALRAREDVKMDAGVKTRLNQKLDQFLKNKPGLERGYNDADPSSVYYNNKQMTKIMSGNIPNQNQTL